jgi:protoporphyrin/coproporphyrin ferrochelatase
LSTRHVILLTYGEPPTPDYLPQLRYSWRILLGLTRTVAPIPRPALPIIALSRARSRRKLWSAERYGSPLEPITRAQGARLQKALDARGSSIRWRVHVAYEFRDPLLTRVLDGLPEGEAVDVVPMYVADSAFTHGIARGTLRAWESHHESRAAPVRVLAPLGEDTFAAIASAFVERQLDERGAGGPDSALVLAAHGTLLDPPHGVDTGRVSTERVRAGIARRLAGRFGMVMGGWLNHRFGGRWTEPSVADTLRQVVEAGFRRVVYVPFGFSSDNAESELEGRIALRAHPQVNAVHLPCLNDDPAFIDALADGIVAALGGTGASGRGGVAAPRG